MERTKKKPRKRLKENTYHLLVGTVAILIGIILLIGLPITILEILWPKGSIRHQIYERISSQLDECKTLGHSGIQIRGQILLMGHKFNTYKDGTTFLPYRIPRWDFDDKIKDLATSVDINREMTVFIVRTTNLGQVGTYHSSYAKDGQAYCVRFDIYVFSWPAAVPLGFHSIVSDPPENITTWTTFSYTEEIGKVFGDPNDIAEWINTIPRQ